MQAIRVAAASSRRITGWKPVPLLPYLNRLGAFLPDAHRLASAREVVSLARMKKRVSAPIDSRGDVVIRTIAMPADANANGDIFGGWLFSQMDLGGAVLARSTARSRVVTVAVEAMNFVTPVNVGDIVTCYARLEKIGNTSMKIVVEAWVKRGTDQTEHHVTRGLFTYVAIDETGKPQPVKRG